MLIGYKLLGNEALLAIKMKVRLYFEKRKTDEIVFLRIKCSLNLYLSYVSFDICGAALKQLHRAHFLRECNSLRNFSLDITNK